MLKNFSIKEDFFENFEKITPSLVNNNINYDSNNLNTNNFVLYNNDTDNISHNNNFNYIKNSFKDYKKAIKLLFENKEKFESFKYLGIKKIIPEGSDTIFYGNVKTRASSKFLSSKI